MSKKKDSVLEMNRSTKVLIIISAIVAVLSLTLYIVTGRFVQEKEEPVYVPPSGLSSSIFDVQNMVYTAVAGLDSKYELPDIPFTVDVPAGSRATVGAAMIVSNDPYYFYYNVVSPEVDMCVSLAEGLTSIVSIGADASLTAANLLYAEDGFINGCEATYGVVELLVDGVDEPRYVVAYKLHFGEKVYRMDKDIIIGCMTTGFNTKNLSDLQSLVESSTGTLAYNEDYKNRLDGE